MIEAKNVSKTYKTGKKALSGVSFTISEGITAILGRNGAGKTTLLRILSTQLMPTSGKVFIDGIDLVKDPYSVRKKISSIPQEASPIGILTPMEHLLIYLNAKSITGKEAVQAAQRAMKTLDIADVANLTTDEMSGGMKRKVFVAMALACKASIVFLDEPTTGLDPISRIEVWHAIKALKGTVLLTTHYMEEAKALAKEVILFDGGKIIARGTTDELIAKYKNLVRVEGVKTGKNWHKVGTLYISYVKKTDAKNYIGKGVIIKDVDLEDIFIMKGIETNIREDGSEGGEYEG